MSLADRLDAPVPEGWKPEPGDKIVGTIVEVTSGNSDWTESYPILVLTLEDGSERSVHCFHTVLKGEIERLQPQEGDEIGIKYNGIPAGKRYESYRVVLERHSPKPAAPVAPAPASAPAEPSDEDLFG